MLKEYIPPLFRRRLRCCSRQFSTQPIDHGRECVSLIVLGNIGTGSPLMSLDL